jgi:phosphomannomutase/phosphoglucomutase
VFAKCIFTFSGPAQCIDYLKRDEWKEQPMSIFKACDIRAPYPNELKDEHAIQLGKAIASLLGPCDILVGGDGRLSTPRLKGLLIDSLLASGCHVIDLGMIPTPALYFARQVLGVKAGVMVTASHNPPQYNGFKLAFGDLPITEEEIADLQELMTKSSSILLDADQRRAESIDILPDYTRFAREQIAPLNGGQFETELKRDITGVNLFL